MDLVLDYLAWIWAQVTPQGVLIGLIVGSVLTWFGRGDWDAIEDD